MKAYRGAVGNRVVWALDFLLTAGCVVCTVLSLVLLAGKPSEWSGTTSLSAAALLALLVVRLNIHSSRRRELCRLAWTLRAYTAQYEHGTMLHVVGDDVLLVIHRPGWSRLIVTRYRRVTPADAAPVVSTEKFRIPLRGSPTRWLDALTTPDSPIPPPRPLSGTEMRTTFGLLADLVAPTDDLQVLLSQVGNAVVTSQPPAWLSSPDPGPGRGPA